MTADAQTVARWQARTRAEIASAGVMDQLADRYEAHVPDGAAVATALRRAAEDERRHAGLCREVLGLLGAPFDEEVPIPGLPASASGDLQLALLEHVVFLLVAGEAIAAAMLRAAVPGTAHLPVAARVATIADDEGRHARLGLVAADTLVAALDAEQRALAPQLVPPQVVRAVEAARRVGPMGPDGAAWGLLDGEQAFAIAKDVVVQHVGPALQSRGLWGRPRG